MDPHEELPPFFEAEDTMSSVGYGGISDVSPELAEVMRRNSEALNEMLTSKAVCSD